MQLLVSQRTSSCYDVFGVVLILNNNEDGPHYAVDKGCQSIVCVRARPSVCVREREREGGSEKKVYNN